MTLPKEYLDELEVLNEQVKAQQPSDILKFCADWFNNKLYERTGSRTGSGSGAGLTKQFNFHSFSGGDPTASSKDDPLSGGAGSNSNAHGTSKDAADPTASGSKFEDSDSVGELPNLHVPANFNTNRRTSVSAESLNPGAFAGVPEPSNSGLTPAQIELLNRALAKNFIFKNMDEDSLTPVLHSLKERKVSKGTEIIKQGDEGDYFYIVAEGRVEISQDGKLVNSGGPESSFGELALMYNAPRAATVVAATDCVLWALDRITFKKILLEKTAAKRAMYEGFLKEVPILSVLSPYERSKIADALQSEEFEAGQVVVKEGDEGDKFYLVESGEAVVTKDKEGQVQKLSKGDYFGEVALLNETRRAATVTAATKLKVATLDKNGFQRLLGRAVDVLRRQDPTHDEGAA